jgi:hypothetical protein
VFVGLIGVLKRKMGVPRRMQAIDALQETESRFWQ